jgi:hypothetical protein
MGTSTHILEWEGPGLPVDADLDQRQGFRVAFDGDAVEPFDDARLDGRAGPGEGVEHYAAGWGDEADEPPHEAEGLHGAMRYTLRRRAAVFADACR